MKPPIILRVYKGNSLVEVKQFQLEQVIFGRDADVQVDVKDEKVSAIHCLIELRDSGYYVCDLGSESGTFKNGKQVLDEPLSSGDEIVIGAHRIQFFVGAPKPRTESGVFQIPVEEAPAVVAAPVKTQEVTREPAKEVVKENPVAPAQKVKAPVPPPKLPEQTYVPSQKRQDTGVVYSKKKGKKTFAPPSEIVNLNDHLKPLKGPVLEVVVAWKERVLETYHFSSGKKVITLGSHGLADIAVPQGTAVQTLPFIEFGAGCQIHIRPEMVASLKSSSQTYDSEQLQRLGKSVRGTTSQVLRLDQGEMASIEMGVLNIYVRFVPDMKKPTLVGLDLSSGELTALIFSLVVSTLVALYSIVYSPAPVEEIKKEEEIRIAKFVVNKPNQPEPKQESSPKEEETPPPPSTTIMKKVQVTDKSEERKGVKETESKVAAQERAKAAEVKVIEDSKNKPKKFTSTKQGGAVKIGEKEGANAKSKDVSTVGLLSAFGGGGVRSKVDTAYSGAGDLMGMANQASGRAGQNSDRAGDDIGSKFKDTGAGGKGTATQGISGIGTKGRASGMSNYGGGVGLGGKSNVSLEIGGTEEANWTGKIDKEAVRRVILEHINQVRSCYERALQTNPDLSGKVMIYFEIASQGVVRVARVNERSSTLSDLNVGGCIALRLKEWRFPEPPADVVATVEYPFAFAAQK